MKARIPQNGETKIEDGKMYVFNNNEWVETQVKAEDGAVIDSGLTLYDMNKQLVSQLPNMTLEQLVELKKVIYEYDLKQSAGYYMLLCNDWHYYTVFDTWTTGEADLEDEVVTCLQEFTDGVKSIELTEGEDSVEIWFEKDNETYVMYFFNYDFGVISCG